MVVRAMLCGMALAASTVAWAGPGAQAGNEAADAARRLRADAAGPAQTAANDIGENGARIASDTSDATQARPCRDNRAMKALGRMSRQMQTPCI